MTTFSDDVVGLFLWCLPCPSRGRKVKSISQTPLQLGNTEVSGKRQVCCPLYWSHEEVGSFCRQDSAVRAESKEAALLAPPAAPAPLALSHLAALSVTV